MKKAIFFPTAIVMLALFVLPSILALNVSVSSPSQNQVLVKGLNESVNFNLSVTNHGASDEFHLYNLVGFLMNPSKPFSLQQGETKNISVSITPISPLDYNGYYTFNYFVQNTAGDNSPESLTFLVTTLKDSFSVGASEINPESNSITIYIKNKVNHNFNNVNVNFKSPFFTLKKDLSLAPYQEKDFNITLNKNDFKSLLAGFYTMSADINVQGATTSVQGNIKFAQKDIVQTSEQDSGFIINTKTIEKTNNGNVVADSQTVVKKNIISRLFTSFSPAPDSVYRQGFTVYYTWDNKIQPGSTIKISAKTNWLLPIFIVLFLIALVILIKQFSKTALTMEKKVSFLHAKGGEFALKVTINVSAKKFVERLTVTDKLPPLVKLYEKFGIEKPSRVDEKNRRVEWYFDSLEAGETRVLSYILYSKVGVLGRFALPTSTAIFEQNGKISEAESNRAFMVAEQSRERLS